MTPKEFLISYVEKFNVADISSLINMYEIDACFVSQGEIIKGIKNIYMLNKSSVSLRYLILRTQSITFNYDPFTKFHWFVRGL